MADLHGRFVLERQRERLRDTYHNHELGAAHDGRRVAEKQLAATRMRLKTERGQRAAYRRSLRAVERERNRLRKAVATERRRADREMLDGRVANDARRGPAPLAAPGRPAPPRGSPPQP